MPHFDVTIVAIAHHKSTDEIYDRVEISDSYCIVNDSKYQPLPRGISLLLPTKRVGERSNIYHQDFVEYTGNESQPAENVYIMRALLVRSKNENV